MDDTKEDLRFIVNGSAAMLICVYNVYDRREEVLDGNRTSYRQFKALNLPSAAMLRSNHSAGFKLREKPTLFAALLRRRNIRRKLKVIMQLNIFISNLDYCVLSFLPEAAGEGRRTHRPTRVIREQVFVFTAKLNAADSSS